MNEDMFTNIHTSDKPLVMATNAGVKKMDLDGDLKGIGPAKFDTSQMANILGLRTCVTNTALHMIIIKRMHSSSTLIVES